MTPLQPNARARERIERLGEEFLVEILTRETERKPGNVAALAELAQALTRLGRHADGLLVDQRLVRLAPDDPVVHYNLACSLALVRQVEDALDELERAIELGYDDAEHLLGDADLARLHGEQRFDELLRRLSRSGRSVGPTGD